VAHGRARPAVAIYPAISEQLQLAVGYAVSGDKTPEQAVDDAWRAVVAAAARKGEGEGGKGRGFGALAVGPALLAVAVAAAAVRLGLGMALAVLIGSARRRAAPGTLAARVAVVSAWVIPGVLVGVLWRILLVENRSGILNYWLSLVGLGPLPFLSTSALAMASVIAANTWRGCAFSMILQFAGLQRVPVELHEAADLEGLGAWPRFRMVLPPPIAPVLALTLAFIP